MKKIIGMALGLLFTTFCVWGQDMFPARKLTTDQGREGFASWSPRGDSLFYQYSDRRDTLGMNGLWKIARDGSGAIQVYAGIAEHAKWSPDGRHIVFDADTGKAIKLMPAMGGIPKKFFPDSIHIRNGGLPCWSPDASKIAFIEGGTVSLCIYDFHEGQVTPIFREEGLLPLPGGWTPDGQGVLVALMDRQTRRSTIWKISADGKTQEQIPGHHENFYRHLSLSPDGSLLVYAVFEDPYLGLYVMPAEGGPSRPLAVILNGHTEGPAWSPDGRHLVFNRTHEGNADIWIMDVDIEKIWKELRILNKE